MIFSNFKIIRKFPIVPDVFFLQFINSEKSHQSLLSLSKATQSLIFSFHNIICSTQKITSRGWQGCLGFGTCAPARPGGSRWRSGRVRWAPNTARCWPTAPACCQTTAPGHSRTWRPWRAAWTPDSRLAAWEILWQFGCFNVKSVFSEKPDF